MNIVDIALIAILVVAAIGGYRRGAIKEAASLIGLIIIFVIAYSFKENLGNVLCKYGPFFNFSGNIKGLVSLNILLYQLIAFLLIYSVLFGVYQLVLKISGVLQKAIDLTLVFAVPSSVIGSVISVIGCYIILFAVLLCLLVPFNSIPYVSDSFMVETIVYETPVFSTYAKPVSDTISDIYDLTDKLTGSKITINQANLDIIDTMLKYKVVSKKTVSQLVVLDKLKTVEGLDEVLDKYSE